MQRVAFGVPLTYSITFGKEIVATQTSDGIPEIYLGRVPFLFRLKLVDICSPLSPVIGEVLQQSSDLSHFL